MIFYTPFAKYLLKKELTVVWAAGLAADVWIFLVRAGVSALEFLS